MTGKPKIRGKFQPQRSVCVIHTEIHALKYCEDLGAHMNSRYAYEDNTPKKGRGKENKRSDLQNEAYEDEIDNFRVKALKELGMPLNQPDMFGRFELHI